MAVRFKGAYFPKEIILTGVRWYVVYPLSTRHMDETSIKVKGEWYYLYRAVDKTGQTIDFLLTAQRDEHAAKRFLTKAIRRHKGAGEDHD
jgi:transposase-like protein